MRMRGMWPVVMCAACGASASGKPDDAASEGAADARVTDAAGGARPDGALQECARATYTAEQQPAALLVVLDRSASMAQNNKWTFAAQAIVQALDQDVFDALHVGLYAAPTGEVTGPECIFFLPVACQAPPFPQIDVELAGTDKSNAPTGVRRRIKDWLTLNYPDSGLGDASPLYNAVEAALGALRLWPVDGTRILLVVTDGSISCNEFSARPGFGDCNGCERDWEDPRNLVGLLAAANAEGIETFVIGVPGADTYDPSACNYPPYRMRLALSAMAYAGSPDHVPAGCDGTTFTPGGADPTLACHFDMTTGGFSATAVADALSYVRGETLGCLFEPPEPPVGETIDPDQVNVEYTADGLEVDLAKRGSAANPCTDVGCWDYTPEGKIELVGQACDAIKSAGDVVVRIIVGCETIVL